MALILDDRIKETSTSTGTGAFALAGPVSGFVSFQSVLGSYATTFYTITDGVDWEVGVGTYADFTIPTTIGSSYNGGYYAGQINYGANTSFPNFRNLIVCPAADAFVTDMVGTTTTTSNVSGSINTASLISDGVWAASTVTSFSIGGYTDWYIPSIQELEICYYNLKPNITDNVTFLGSNVYAVPPRLTNYTLQNPTQTSAVDFQFPGGAEAFDPTVLNGGAWASTTFGSNVYFKQFTDGFSTYLLNFVSNTVRAIRSEAVTPGSVLYRDTVLSSSNGGSIVPFSPGPKDVFVTYPADLAGPIVQNNTQIAKAVTLFQNFNGHSVGPVTILSTGSVTVPPGQSWLVD